MLQCVVHVECHHHAHIHVDELGGEIEVALQVACIHYVDNDVGCLIDDVLTHVKFFGTVCRERIGARQVDQPEVIALEIEMPFFGIYRYSAIVAYMFVRSRSDVEK